MKLSNEEIARVFAMYCPYKVNFEREFIYQDTSTEKKIFDLGYRDMDTINKFYGKGHPFTKSVSDKLLLTTLPEITDEDAIEVAKMIVNDQFVVKFRTVLSMNLWGKYHDLHIGFEKFSISCFYSYYSERREIIINPTTLFSIYQFLVSRSYAVPIWFGINHWANGKDAIELGIAINKNTLK